MPLSPIAEFVLRPIFDVLFYGLGYLTGLILVPVCTLGTYSVESLVPSQRPRPKLRKRKRAKNAELPPRTVSADTATTIGIIFWGAVILAALFFWQGDRT